MIGQKDPWEGFDWKGIVLNVKKGERLEKGTIPTKLYEIMLLCWKEKPEDRPSFGQLSKLLKATKGTTSQIISPPSSPVTSQIQSLSGFF